MAYYKDLEKCNYFEGIDFQNSLISIGWLDDKHNYTKGIVPEIVQKKLLKLLEEPWQPVILMGPHKCEMCVDKKEYDIFDEKPQIGFGIKNIFIPGVNKIYVAPELVIHYINVHNYCPPEEFQKAIMDCPEMESDLYYKKMGIKN